MQLFGLAVDSIFAKNILLAYFLGMCSYLAVSKKVKTAVGMGLAVTFVLSLSAPVNWVLYKFVLSPGALSTLHPAFADVDLSFLKIIAFISVTAALVQIAEMIIEKVSPSLYAALGIFLPLITVNCAVLGVSLFMVERSYSLVQTSVFAFSSGIGWLLAIAAMAAVREKIKYSNVPKPLQGLGISMIITGLIAMSFMAFSGGH